MKKTELRKVYKERRKALSEQELEDLSLQIANQLLQLSIWEYSYYHIFLPITSQNEVNTEYILNILSGKDKHIVISKSDFSTYELSHFLLTDNTKIRLNQWNIPEPVDGIPIDTKLIDVVFVPLLAFDEKGHRVGYGKGFYDRFLSQCKPDTIKIGLSFFDAETNIEGVSKEDISLDYCVTPEKTFQF